MEVVGWIEGVIARHPYAAIVLGLTLIYYYVLPVVLFGLRRLLLFGLSVSRASLTVHNVATVPCFVALYDNQTSKQVSDTMVLQPMETKKLTLPPSSSWQSEPVLAWSLQSADLNKFRQSFKWRRIGVGLSNQALALEFVLRHPVVGETRHLGDISLLTKFEESVLSRIDRVVKGSTSKFMAADHKAAPCVAGDVQVEHVKDIPEAERQWRVKREKNTQQAMNTLLGTEGKKARIALFTSGGGVRAMVSFLGALEGLNREGVLPAVTYVAGCSGSCWGMSAFMRLVELSPDASMEQVLEKCRATTREALSTNLLPPFAEATKLVLTGLSRKLHYLQSLSLVTVYGQILSNRWPTSTNLSDQASCLANGMWPLPLYAAATVDNAAKRVVTAEFSPLAVSCFNKAIPPQALGRRFNHGRTIDSYPGVQMDDLSGMFGSAFCTTVEKVCENAFWVGAESADKLKAFVRESAVEYAWGGLKSTIEKVGISNRDTALSIPAVYPLHLHNWAFESDSETDTPATLPFFDAGVDCNIPWSFAHGREIDVIIALDHSDDTTGDKGFLTLAGLSKLRRREIEEFGRTRLPEPTPMGKRTISVFGNPEKDEIVVIYIPTKKNQESDFDIESEMGPTGFCNVVNFRYDNVQFDKLYNLSRGNMSYHKPQIVQAIRSAAK